MSAGLRVAGRSLRQHLSGAGLKRAALLLLSVAALGACTSVPDGVTPVSPFELDRYLGRWYEIARLDHSFERGLSDVTADYRLQADGSVEVVNRGYDGKKAEWREAVGRAVFLGERDVGSLKVSFSGPSMVAITLPISISRAIAGRSSPGPTATTCGFWRAPPNSLPRCGSVW